ncbi:hypothetical protein BDR05DRAFT_896181, partial [Suillus weaverae]
RFCNVPTFGWDTICKFHCNVSNLTKLAARDFEDILQCAIPVFEGLLPSDHNEVILDLLFELVMWHALGKLRLHTKTTLHFLNNSTTRLGQAMCRFKDITCDAFVTQELPKEVAARWCHKPAYSKNGKSKSQPKKTASDAHWTRLFNMSTYKLRALRDHVKSIWLFGTTDNFSMQVVSSFHNLCYYIST